MILENKSECIVNGVWYLSYFLVLCILYFEDEVYIWYDDSKDNDNDKV